MMEEYRYKAVARAAYGDIVEGATVTISSERVVEQSTGLSFRHEIAEACRQQLGVQIADDEEARLATNFDVYSEQRYEEVVRPKLEAAAEKERQRQQREADRAARSSKGKKSSKSSKNGTNKIGKLTVAQWKRLLKFLLGVIVVVWFLSTQVKSCSFNDLLTQARDTIEQMTKTSSKKSTTTKKATTTKKTSTKKATTAKKSSSTTAKKKSTSTAKKSTTTKKSTTAKKSSTSTAKKKTATSKKKSTGSRTKKKSTN
ncbi:MAG: hypothetical protein IKX44_03220 [Prevotella sp.]|nr:hypothetical protein [Prevotella sp.]